MSDARPRILAILPAFIPSAQMCVVKPILRLHRGKYLMAKITVEYVVHRKDLEWADLVIFCRNTEPQYIWILDTLLERNIPFVYDIDDNFFEIPLDLEVGRYHRDPKRLAMHTRYLESSDLVRVYSDSLLKKFKSMDVKVEKVTSPLDWSLISPPPENSRTERVKIVYATSRIDDRLAPFFIPAIQHVLNRYGNHVEFHFWGHHPQNVKDLERIHYHPVIFNYDQFLQRFSKVGFDIGLAPLMDDEFHRSKTNNKFREYGACRVAGIYSDVEVYSNCVCNGETGLLVTNDTDSWYRAMVQLIEDPHLRGKIKRQAFEYLREHYPENDFESQWWKQIQSVLARNKENASFTQKANRIQSQKIKTGGQRGAIFPSKTGLLRQGIVSFFRHLRHTGIRFTMRLVKQKLFDRWTVLKLRIFTSAVFGIFQQH